VTELTWISSASASALYAAAMLARGVHLIDARWEQALAEAVRNLTTLLTAHSISLEAFFDHVVPLATFSENQRELAGNIARRATGQRPTEEFVSELAAAILVIEKIGGQQVPNTVAEIDLRSRLLREQWESRGPGLLAAISRATAAELQVPHANVLAVLPITGGGGQVYLPYDSLSIETMLANPHAELPEVVRLGWLIAALPMGQPRFCQSVSAARLPRLAGLSLLPAALEAAEYVELARSDPLSWKLAIDAWRLAEPERTEHAAQLVETLADWWRTFRQSPTSWAVALTALDRMLAAEQL
jgi:hypothetical protein